MAENRRLFGLENHITRAITYLERLVAFPTVSGLSNLDIINYVRDVLLELGVVSFISYDESGKRANLHALIGPEIDGGVALNGHTDVVPVEGQQWTSDPFKLVARNNRLFGRGAVDMKGYLACMMAAVPIWQQKSLDRPIHISMCFDEETGGFGAPILVADMGARGPHPAIAIVGEPSRMQIVNAHKGGFEMHTRITGLECHSSDPRLGVNAVEYAARLVRYINAMARDLASRPEKDSRFDPNYTTINVGTIEGGVARNTVAGFCVFDWEMRPMPSIDGKKLVADIEQYAYETLLPEMQAASPGASIRIIMEADVPPLDDTQSGPAVELVSKITGHNATHAVPFGTDAGHFAAADISTVIMGPGSIKQAHKPDEYIEIAEIGACLGFFDQLGDELAQ